MNIIHNRRHLVRICAAGVATILLLAAGAPAASADEVSSRHPSAGPAAAVLLDGLNSPKGLDSFLGQPIVSQGAYGPPGPVVAHIRTPWTAPVTKELTGPISLVDVAVSPDGSMWGLGTDRQLYRKRLSGGSFSAVADIAAYQQSDPDPFNTEGDATESNPFGLAVMANGDALVADAANNDVVRVTPKGQISTLARFDTELVSTDHLGDPTLPPALPAEAVPTSIAVVGHSIYVGELKGFPFRPGSSRIWKIDTRATGVVCSTDPGHATAGCATAMTGFTGIQDLDVNAWTGETYVYQIAAGGVLAFEGGFESGQFPPAVLERVSRSGQRSELAPGELSQAGGVDVGVFGTVHVTDHVFTGGRLLRINN